MLKHSFVLWSKSIWVFLTVYPISLNLLLLKPMLFSSAQLNILLRSSCIFWQSLWFAISFTTLMSSVKELAILKFRCQCMSKWIWWKVRIPALSLVESHFLHQRAVNMFLHCRIFVSYLSGNIESSYIIYLLSRSSGCQVQQVRSLYSSPHVCMYHVRGKQSEWVKLKK